MTTTSGRSSGESLVGNTTGLGVSSVCGGKPLEGALMHVGAALLGCCSALGVGGVLQCARGGWGAAVR